MRLCLAVTVFGTGVMESRRRGLGLMQSQKAWSLVILFDEMDNFLGDVVCSRVADYEIVVKR